MKMTKTLFAALFALTFSMSASATLIGIDNVDILATGESGDPAGSGGCSGITVVDPGLDCSIGDGGIGGALDTVHVDILDSAVVFSFEEMSTTGLGTWEWSEPSGEEITITVSNLRWLDHPDSFILDIDVTDGLEPLDGGSWEVDFDDNEIVLALSSDFIIDAGCPRSDCGSITVAITPDMPHDPPTTVPEPTTLALLGLGLAGIGARRRRNS